MLKIKDIVAKILSIVGAADKLFAPAKRPAILTFAAAAFSVPFADSAPARQSTTSDGLEILNIAMLFDGEIERQALDMVDMSKKRVADIHMISFFLVPEGNPPFDKISLYEDKYRRLRKAIGDADCKTGIILQATLGHGFDLEVPHPFQQMVSRENDRENWMKNIVCPLDENFRKYILDCVKRVAKLKPSLMMIDGDFRLICGRYGCLCPLHLAKIEEKYGYKLTRESLQKHLKGKSELDKKISDAAFEVDADSLKTLASEIRKAIDSVDPSIPCDMCCADADMGYAGDIARILAAKGQPATLRIGNARYMIASYRNLHNSAYKIAAQNAVSKPDRFYAELDTFPRNRYFTSARTLHALFIVSILEGASGAKYWPNRLVDYEPQSGAAYKKLFAENRRLYDTLYRDIKGMKYSGVSDIICAKPQNLRRDSRIHIAEKDYWGTTVGVMGLPCAFTEIDKLDRPALLRYEIAKDLTDAQVKKLLALGCVLDGDAALELQKRGFGKYLGVKVSPWNKSEKISREMFCDNCGKASGKFCEPPNNPVKLETLSPDTEIFSNFVHLPYTYGDKSLSKKLAPATTLFKNSLGGKVAVFASRPEGPNHLTESRKAQYLEIFNRIAPYTLWYDGDAESYLKSAELRNGSELSVFTNVGVDTINPIVFATTKKFSRAEFLDTDGVWKPAEFSRESDGKTVVNKSAEIYNPVILRFFK